MRFVGEIAEIQQRLTRSREFADRRHTVLQELAPRRGERIVEVGCGAGLLLREIGISLGPHGLALGLDISPDQIATAAKECAGVPAVVPQVGDLLAIDQPDGVFDAAVAVQVIEYVEAAEAAVSEIRRILKPGGRFVCLATNWDTAVWHGVPRALTAEITAAWESHAPWPNLPAVLAPMLARRGFRVTRQIPVPVVNPSWHPDSFAWGTAHLMAAHAVESGVSETVAHDWLDALEKAEAAEEFFFSSLPIMTTAIAG